MSDPSTLSSDLLSCITVVLARPEGQTNIGTICRAMKTMGLTRLKIADMQTPEDIETIKKWSLSAFDIYEEAEHFDHLRSAIASATIVAATSRRIGKNRKFFSFTAREFAHQLKNYPTGEIALVFGNEKHGLNEEEMDLCQILIHIPTSELYPSLNLAQAVQIVAYEIYSHQAIPEVNFRAITAAQSHQLAENIADNLDSFGYFAISKEAGKRHLFNFWHAIIARSQLSLKEATYMEKMFRQLTRMKRKEPLSKDARKKAT